VRQLPKTVIVVVLILLTAALAACGPAADPGDNAGQVPLVDAARAASPSPIAPAASAPATSLPAQGDAAPPELAVPTPASIEPRALTALGDPAAPVTIVEYSDYHCPFCQRHFQETLPGLIENYIETGRVYYVFKDFPIASLHPLAYRLHEAALCIGNEAGGDAYWAAHDLFFADSQFTQVASLEQLDGAITGALSADYPGLAGCLESGETSAEVEAGIAEGAALGVNGTPSFFINGYPVVGAQPYETFEYVIGLAETGELESAFREAAEQQAAAIATATAQAAIPVDIPLEDSPARGEAGAPVVVVEYSDYQCPFCWRHFQETMPQMQEYIDAGQVRYVFKDYPIRRIHPEAQKAHEAARCAREQGGDDAYWAMHDLLFASQDEWSGSATSVDVFKRLAAEAGHDSEAFDACLDEGRYEAIVSADLAEGGQLGISGTPTFFINGIRLVGAQPFSVFEQAIQAALAQ
jgi:protein-disulfide isomerase